MGTGERPTRAVRLWDRLSGVYDTRFVQRLAYRATQDQVIDQLREFAPRRVLDVGCGTGQLTARLPDALDAEQVYGCDAAPGMLAQARRRSTVVEWIQGAAEAVPLPDASVDAIVSTEAFHWFDQPAALREFHRLLVPGGQLVVAFVSPRTAAASRALDASGVLGVGGHWPHRAKMRRLAEEAGFRVERQRQVRRGLATVVPTVITVSTRT
jgi:ubiquinone/menaquinone biosynthesis C-methylase UbiE